MKPTYSRRYRRSTPTTREAAISKKDNPHEHAFFAAPSNQSFFKPNAAIQRKCAHCEAEEKQVSRMPADEEKKIHKKEEDKELHRQLGNKEDEKKIQKTEDKKEEHAIHRMEEKKEEKVIHKMEEKKEEHVHRMEDKKEELSVAKRATGAGSVDTSTSAYIHSLDGKGSTLPADAQHFFKKRMGQDFGHVRIHTGAEAEQSAKDMSAKAYAVDNHVVFNKGQYNPGSSEGKKLLAHELTHVVQQKGNSQDLLSRVTEVTGPAQAVESSGQATNSVNERAFGCEGVSVEGHTDANYTDSYNSSGSATPSNRCKDCTDDCISASGTIISIFKANPSVTLPSVPGGLSDCETAAVDKFINTTLNNHEQKHVKAFNSYNGTVKTPYKFVGCQGDLDPYLQSRHDAINAKRQAAANARSKALDPFNPPIPCKCDDAKS